MDRLPALPDRPLSHPARAAAALTFGTVAGLRHARGLHPGGVARHAVLRVPGGRCPGVPLLDEPGEHAAIVRLSNALGAPLGRPDGIGLALRVPDAHGPGRHQDLLVTGTSGRPVPAAPAPGRPQVLLAPGPGGRRVLRPLPLPAPRGFSGTTFSSLVPLRLGGRLRMVGARAAAPFPDRGFADLDAARVAKRFSLCTAPLAGHFTPVAEIELGEALEAAAAEALDLDPLHTGGGIEPVRLLRGIRAAAYRASRARRGLPDSAV